MSVGCSRAGLKRANIVMNFSQQTINMNDISSRGSRVGVGACRRNKLL